MILTPFVERQCRIKTWRWPLRSFCWLEFISLLFLLAVVGTVMWFGGIVCTSTSARFWSGLSNRGAHSVLGNAVTTLWMTCCINQCLKIMILKLFKLKTKKKDFGCLPWVGYLLESHAVELLKKVHMELSPLMFFFMKITCWIYHKYNGIYIFFYLVFPCLFLAPLCIHDSTKMAKLCTWEANPATLTVTWAILGRESTNEVNVQLYTKLHTSIHLNIHDLKWNKSIFIPSVASKIPLRIKNIL